MPLTLGHDYPRTCRSKDVDPVGNKDVTHSVTVRVITGSRFSGYTNKDGEGVTHEKRPLVVHYGSRSVGREWDYPGRCPGTGSEGTENTRLEREKDCRMTGTRNGIYSVPCIRMESGGVKGMCHLLVSWRGLPSRSLLKGSDDRGSR